MLWFRVPLYIMTIDDLEMLLATYKKDKSRFDDVVKALVENKRGGNDYKSVLEILNIYQAVGDMHFIFGISTYPIVPYRNLPQILSGMTAHWCSLISGVSTLGADPIKKI